ncbi:MAG: hypothetical protein KAS32_30885 [Candidatus Peribacteraceae bacterium]|nr:hypothetical protein [Candidatus Peribacteraceae bacterium]
MILIILGVLLIGLAIGLKLWLGKRLFERMSSGGVQQFESYGALWKSRIMEFGVKIVLLLLLLSGVAVLVQGLMK